MIMDNILYELNASPDVDYAVVDDLLTLPGIDTCRNTGFFKSVPGRWLPIYREGGGNRRTGYRHEYATVLHKGQHLQKF